MKKLLTTKEVAKMLNISYQSVGRLMYNPIEPLHYLRIGGTIRFEGKDVLAYKYFKKKFTQLNTSQRCEIGDYNG